MLIAQYTIYTCYNGLSVVGYFGSDDRQSADTFSSIALYIVLFCEFSVFQSANIGRYFTKFLIPEFPVVPILASSYKLKINILRIVPAEV